MNGSKNRPLSSGSRIFRGSPESRIIIGLVIVAVIVGAVAFALFAANQSQEKSLKAKQAELDSIAGNLSQVTVDFSALNTNYTYLSGQFATVKANYDNVTQQYLALQNRSSAVDTRLNTFLENQPTIAYTSRIGTKLLPDNMSDKVITVTAYNLGKTDAGSIMIKCTVKLGNQTNVYNQTYTYVRSLDKREATWEFSNETNIIDVWAGLN